MINDVNDELILTARLLLATLFLIFGWRKFRDYSGTVRQIAELGGPMPRLAAAIAILMELPVGTALFGHRFWTMTAAERVDNMDGFYKNLSIMGGFLLLYITGAGKYSIDALRNIAGP